MPQQQDVRAWCRQSAVNQRKADPGSRLTREDGPSLTGMDGLDLFEHLLGHSKCTAAWRHARRFSGEKERRIMTLYCCAAVQDINGHWAEAGAKEAALAFERARELGSRRCI